MLKPHRPSVSTHYYCDTCELDIIRGMQGRPALTFCRNCLGYAGIVKESDRAESPATYRLKKLWEAGERRKRNKKVAEEYKLKPKSKQPPIQGPAGDFDD